MTWKTILKAQDIEYMFYTEAPNPVFLVTAEMSDFIERNEDIKYLGGKNGQGRIGGILNNYHAAKIISDKYTNVELSSMLKDKLIELGWDKKSAKKFEREMEGGYIITAIIG